MWRADADGGAPTPRSSPGARLSLPPNSIPAGATEDTIATVPSGGAPSTANGFALYNRNLHVTNGATAANPPRGTYSGQGGMMTFITP